LHFSQGSANVPKGQGAFSYLMLCIHLLPARLLAALLQPGLHRESI